MLLLVAFGFMNLLAMVALAALILAEKYWSAGERLARVVGIVLIGLAVMALLAPGLVHGVGHQPMSDMT
jgi:predicted metal-binding membrane protein